MSNEIKQIKEISNIDDERLPIYKIVFKSINNWTCWKKRWVRLIFIILCVCLCNFLINILINDLNQWLIKTYNNHFFGIILTDDKFIDVLQTIWLGQLTLCSLTIPVLLYLFSNKKEFLYYSTIEIIEFRHINGLKTFSFIDILIFPFIILILDYFYMIKLESIPLVFNMILTIVLILYLIIKISNYVTDKHKPIKMIFNTLFELINRYDYKKDEFNDIINDFIGYIYTENYISIKHQIVYTNHNLNELVSKYVKSYICKNNDNTFKDINKKLKDIFHVIYNVCISNNDSEMFNMSMSSMIDSYITIFINIIKNTKDNDTLKLKKTLLCEIFKKNIESCILKSYNNINNGHNTFNLDISSLLEIILSRLDNMYIHKQIDALKHIITIIEPLYHLVDTSLMHDFVDKSKLPIYSRYICYIKTLYKNLYNQ